MTLHHDTQTLHIGADGWDRVQGYSVIGIEGPDASKRIDSPADRCSIGTHDSNHLKLEDRMVSRFHCELRVESRLARILDLDSKNGTFVDGIRIRDAYLRDGSLIKLGQSTLRFELGSKTRSTPISPKCEFGTLVGLSAVMRSLFDVLERVAPSDSTILLEGETGTGKGITAESIHDHSLRHKQPFGVVDCTAVPANLLESELFGHERGAFTGATTRRLGAFEAANAGTLFLDEIGELPLELQPKLLRALEERQIRRVGTNAPTPIDVRVVAATSRDLRKEVNEGRFRSDLYFRLAVIYLRIPALREHPEDIPLLVEGMLRRSPLASDRMVAELQSPDFLATLQRAAWPGNVRELRNHIERCLVLRQVVPFGGLDQQQPGSAPPSDSAKCDPNQPYHQARQQSQMHWEKDYLRALLNHHDENVDQAALAAGISRAYLYRLLSRHGIRRGL